MSNTNVPTQVSLTATASAEVPSANRDEEEPACHRLSCILGALYHALNQADPAPIQHLHRELSSEVFKNPGLLDSPLLRQIEQRTYRHFTDLKFGDAVIEDAAGIRSRIMSASSEFR